MIEVKSIQSFLINIDGNQKVVYYEPETKTLLGYTFTKDQEAEIMKIIDPPISEINTAVITDGILQDALNMKIEVQDALEKIKEIYVN